VCSSDLVEAQRIEKEFGFGNFREALGFTVRVGELAESVGHHPEIVLSWGKVRILLWTHKINGLAEADFVLAAKIDRLLEACK
jgi:4a-hydroxytetrahydrobiopterin dehydratase